MEKIIKLKMGKDKSLKIYINDAEKYSISDRSISADKIYEIVDFAIGDNYTITSECEGNTDQKVLDFFKELFDNIAEKVNALSEKTN